MKNLSFLIAWRYIGARHKEKNIATMVKICFFGIFIGTFALAVVTAVMNGFEKVTHEKMQTIHPQLTVQANGQPLDLQAFSRLFAQLPDMAAFSPIETKHAMIQDPDSGEVNTVVVLYGIDPSKESTVSSLETKIIHPSSHQKLSELLIANQVILGKKLAQSLAVTTQRSMTIFFAPEIEARKKMTLESADIVVGGLFETGIEDIDHNVIFCSLDFVRTLFPDAGVTQIGLKLKPGADERQVIDQLKARVPNIEVYSWKDLYPALVSALKLEKYVMFFILALITLVASMNIISLLFMQITQKQGDIAILQAMGCGQRTVQHIFLWMGSIIAGTATLLGLTAAVLACFILERYPFIELPDVYYVGTSLPVHMELRLFVIIFMVVMALSFFAVWLPIQRIGTIKIAQVLRTEAA